jgi:hypothetical protein
MLIGLQDKGLNARDGDDELVMGLVGRQLGYLLRLSALAVSCSECLPHPPQCHQY